MAFRSGNLPVILTLFALLASSGFAEKVTEADRVRARRLAKQISADETFGTHSPALGEAENRRAFLYLAEHHDDARIIKMSLLALGSHYSGNPKTIEMHRWSGQHRTIQQVLPDDDLFRVFRQRLHSENHKIRQKAWRLADAFLECEVLDPTFVNYYCQTLRDRSETWEVENIWRARLLRSHSPKLEELQLELLKGTTNDRAVSRIYFTVEKRPDLFKARLAEIKEVLLQDLFYARPLVRGTAVDAGLTLEHQDPEFSVRYRRALEVLSVDDSPFVASKSVIALGKCGVLPRVGLLKLLKTSQPNTVHSNWHGSFLRTSDDAALRALHFATEHTDNPFNYKLIKRSWPSEEEKKKYKEIREAEVQRALQQLGAF